MCIIALRKNGKIVELVDNMDEDIWYFIHGSNNEPYCRTKERTAEGYLIYDLKKLTKCASPNKRISFTKFGINK